MGLRKSVRQNAEEILRNMVSDTGKIGKVQGKEILKFGVWCVFSLEV